MEKAKFVQKRFFSADRTFVTLERFKKTMPIVPETRRTTSVITEIMAPIPAKGI